MYLSLVQKLVLSVNGYNNINTSKKCFQKLSEFERENNCTGKNYLINFLCSHTFLFLFILLYTDSKIEKEVSIQESPSIENNIILCNGYFMSEKNLSVLVFWFSHDFIDSRYHIPKLDWQR